LKRSLNLKNLKNIPRYENPKKSFWAALSGCGDGLEIIVLRELHSVLKKWREFSWI